MIVRVCLRLASSRPLKSSANKVFNLQSIKTKCSRPEVSWDKMENQPMVLCPPEIVRGLKKFDKDSISSFEKKVRVPYIKVSTNGLAHILKYVKSYLLKVEHIKAVQDSQDYGMKEILLNPDIIKSFQSLSIQDRDTLRDAGITEEKGFEWREVTLGYGNWTVEQILKSVLPEGKEGVSAYSRAGHIIHLNLREHLLPFKNVIGKVLLDKLKGITTVVNKEQTISNSFRTFKIELLAGENKMITKVKESGCTMEFDFSTVYWNSRLSTEHERIVSKLKNRAIVYDVFAGVGPFAVPAGKKQCFVFANDLNPESYRWLEHNIVLNKVQDWVTPYNLDGREFLETVFKENMIKQWKEAIEITNNLSVHVIMNLPSTAIEFLDVFLGMYYKSKIDSKRILASLPTVYCYCFAQKGWEKRDVAGVVIDIFHKRLEPFDIEITSVRAVSPNKEMLKLTFKLNERILFEPKRDSYGGHSPAAKRLCMRDNTDED